MHTGTGRSGSVSLRPHTEADLVLDRQEFTGPEGWGEHEWFGYSDPDWLRKKFGATGLLDESVGRLVIESNGEWAGRVTWWNVFHGTDKSAAWRLAVIVRTSLRGRGIGSDAHVALVDYLFAHTRAERLEAFTDAENGAEQRVLDKAGFAYEGTVRTYMWSQGRWRDPRLYSILRSDMGTSPGSGSAGACTAAGPPPARRT